MGPSILTELHRFTGACGLVPGDHMEEEEAEVSPFSSFDASNDADDDRMEVEKLED